MAGKPQTSILANSCHHGSIAGQRAIHSGCAAQARIDLFLTDGSGFLGKVIPGIQFIAGLESDML